MIVLLSWLFTLHPAGTGTDSALFDCRGPGANGTVEMTGDGKMVIAGESAGAGEPLGLGDAPAGLGLGLGVGAAPAIPGKLIDPPVCDPMRAIAVPPAAASITPRVTALTMKVHCMRCTGAVGAGALGI